MFRSPHRIPSESSWWLLPWSRTRLPWRLPLLLWRHDAAGKISWCQWRERSSVRSGSWRIEGHVVSVLFGQKILVKSAPGCFWLSAVTSLESLCFDLFWGQPFVLQLGWCSFVENNLPSLEGTHVFPIGWLLLWSSMHCFKPVIKHHMKLR